MRGRTFLNKFLIIDEAQNLTPKQMKTLITRAGPGTKVICLGNIAQIDTPYLTEGSSGLTMWSTVSRAGNTPATLPYNAASARVSRTTLPKCYNLPDRAVSWTRPDCFWPPVGAAGSLPERSCAYRRVD
jgi:hypothetical protein